ncbi:MAG: MBL fold metallo-hydrolase [Verrucomicrobia bacterium]|nr:MBL fold metallo-hydrolase [Verrucomicrobiota bacterium]
MGYFDEEEKRERAPIDFVYPLPSRELHPEQDSVTWINHSSFLIQMQGLHILTDPIFSHRCSPVSFLGPKRRHPPGVAWEDLPEIDLVLISHNHYDHLDKSTVIALARRFPKITWLVPKGVKRWFDKLQIAPVYELSWWEERRLSLRDIPIKLTAVPAQHYSGRKGFDLNDTLWVGWVLEVADRRCYFVGDTGYNPVDFKEIGLCFEKMDLTLIPIGAYQPKAFMESVHIGPEEAVRIHNEVGSALSVGMHWKTFRLADEPLHQPPYDLYQILLRERIDPRTFLAPPPGHALAW